MKIKCSGHCNRCHPSLCVFFSVLFRLWVTCGHLLTIDSKPTSYPSKKAESEMMKYADKNLSEILNFRLIKLSRIFTFCRENNYFATAEGLKPSFSKLLKDNVEGEMLKSN